MSAVSVCFRCRGDRFEYFPAEGEMFLWKSRYPVRMVSPLTLKRCASCDALQISETQKKQVEIAIENSVPLNFKSDIRKLERLGLSRKSIADESKISLRKIEKIMKSEASVEEKDFAKLLKYMSKRAKALKARKTA